MRILRSITILLALFCISLHSNADELFRAYRYSVFKALPECQKSDIVFIGNSITNMFDWYEAFGSRQNILNRGTSGGYTQEILDNLESMIVGNPAKVFLMIGTNDLGTNGNLYTPELTASRIIRILQRIRQESPNTMVYYQSILPSLVGIRTKEKTERTNRLVLEWICMQNDNHLTYIDLYNLFVKEDGSMPNAQQDPTTLSFDGLHLTQRGYQIWLKEIEKYVGYKSVIEEGLQNECNGVGGSTGMRNTYFNALPLKSTDILFFGDDMVHNAEWHELMRTPDIKDRAAGWGINGLSLEYVAKQFAPALTAGNGGLIRKTPRAMLLFAGMTDVQSNRDIETVIADYRNCVAQLQLLASNHPVFMLQLPPCANNNATLCQRIEKFNSAIAHLADAKANLFVVPVYEAMLSGQSYRDERLFLNHGCHLPNGLGFARIAQVLSTRLNEILGTKYKPVSDREAQANVDRFNSRTAHCNPSLPLVNDEYKVFNGPSDEGIPYRIPAVACNRQGDIICVTDYRYSHADIGMAPNGMLDLRYRIKDHETGRWGDIKTLTSCRLTPQFTSFGDPCIVADRESDRVMVLSCCGNVSFPDGSHENHQGCSRFYSEDGGKTWDEDYVDIAPQVFRQLDQRNDGPIRCFFVGSGKISQSRLIKVGDYYRLYCAILCRLSDNAFANFVLYSDDFGKEWHVLGDINTAPVPAGGDEPKADELPDGSVLISSRINGGRLYNVYHYTDTATGEGSWGEMARSTRENHGVIAEANSCNGEIMIVPVHRRSDKKEMYLLLQSLPFGPNRTRVGIFYKPLLDSADWENGSTIASSWEGRYQVSNTSSAYSTMCLDDNGRIAFFYEENGRFSGYDMVYKNFSISEITGNKYE